MAFVEKELCIRCNKGDDVLLVCREKGCPLAIHAGCMGCPTRFDEVGRFYCPYCRYKLAVAESNRAMEYAEDKRKSLLIFMDVAGTSSRKCLEEKERSEGIDEHNQLQNRVINDDMTSGGHDKTTEIRFSDGVLSQSIHLGEEQNICNAEEEIQNVEKKTSTSPTDQDSALVNKSRIANSEEVVRKASDMESKGQDPALVSDKKWKVGEDEEIQNAEKETSTRSTDQDSALFNKSRIANSEEEVRKAGDMESKGQDPALVSNIKWKVGEDEEIQNAETETSTRSTDQDAALENVNESGIVNLEEEVQKAGETEAFAGSKGQDPALVSDKKWKVGEDKEIKETEMETSAASSDEEHSDKTGEEEKVEKDECKILSPQKRSRAKRGFEKTDPTDKENPNAIDLLEKSFRNKRPSPSATPSRRSSRLSVESPKSKRVAKVYSKSK